MGDLATVKKAKADILLHLDDQTEDEVSQEGAANDRSPPKKKRCYGFEKSKDTKKKAKKTSQKKINKKEKPFVMELGSPADSPASVRAPTFDISAVSFSSFSDDNDVIVKDAFCREVS